MKFSIITIGCKTNFYESNILKHKLESTNVKFIEDYLKAHFVIVNGCIVTYRAQKDTQNVINKILKTNKNLKKIFVFGCFSLILKQNKTVNSKIKYFKNYTSLIEYILKDKKYLTIKEKDITKFYNKSRFFLNIATGCNFNCSYCVIKYARGKLISRNKEEIIEQIKKISLLYPEIILTATSLGEYGKDIYKNFGLYNLILEILKKTNIKLIRLSSINPIHLTNDLLKLIINSKRLAKHIHISLQHVNDNILKLMNRPYNKNYLEKLFSHLDKTKELFVAVDAIVGFNNETNEQFLELINFIINHNISHIHVFPYSHRPLTKHFKEHIKRFQRAKIIRSISKLKFRNFVKTNLGNIFYSIKLNKTTFLTQNYITVKVNKEYNLKPKNELYKIEITGINKDNTVIGNVIS